MLLHERQRNVKSRSNSSTPPQEIVTVTPQEDSGTAASGSNALVTSQMLQTALLDACLDNPDFVRLTEYHIDHLNRHRAYLEEQMDWAWNELHTQKYNYDVMLKQKNSELEEQELFIAQLQDQKQDQVEEAARKAVDDQSEKAARDTQVSPNPPRISPTPKHRP